MPFCGQGGEETVWQEGRAGIERNRRCLDRYAGAKLWRALQIREN